MEDQDFDSEMQRLVDYYGTRGWNEGRKREYFKRLRHWERVQLAHAIDRCIDKYEIFPKVKNEIEYERFLACHCDAGNRIAEHMLQMRTSMHLETPNPGIVRYDFHYGGQEEGEPPF